MKKNAVVGIRPERSFDTEMSRSMDESIQLISAGQPNRWDECERQYFEAHKSFLIMQVHNGSHTGEARLAALDARTDLPGESIATWGQWIFDKVMVGCAYAAEAMISREKGEDVAAWCALIDMREHLAQAEQFWRMKWAEIVVRQQHVDARRITAARAAAKSHAADHNAKELVIAHFIANRPSFASKDEAAEKMAGKLVLHKFRTVRNWLNGL